MDSESQISLGYETSPSTAKFHRGFQKAPGAFPAAVFRRNIFQPSLCFVQMAQVVFFSPIRVNLCPSVAAMNSSIVCLFGFTLAHAPDFL